MVLTTASWEEQLLRSSFGKVFMGAAGSGGPSDDEFNRVSFLSHFEGSNNGVNNAFDDGSASNHTITAAGNVTQGSLNPYGTNWGVDFSLDNNPRLSCGSSADFTFGTGDFTVEFFVFFYSLAGYQTPMSAGYNASGGMFIQTGNGDGKFQFRSGSSAKVSETTSDAVPNKWYHIAFSRQSGTLRVYRNGVQTGTASNSTNLNRTGNILIGSDQDFNINGLLSNVRLVKGTSLYNSDFTPPASALTAVTNTKLLTCQSNRFVDNSASGHTVTPNTGKEKVGSFGPFLTSAVYDAAVNGASAYFDGTGDYLDADDGVTFGTGEFTIEFFVYLDATTQQFFFDARPDGVNTTYPVIYMLSNRKLVYYANSGTKITSTTSETLSKNVWHHIAVCRSGTSTKMFLDGTQVGSTYSDSTNYADSGRMRIGANKNAGSRVRGYISDVRVVNSALYTSNFTPPTAPLTNITNTNLLLNMADGQAIDSAAQNNLTLFGNAKISTGQAKFGNTSMVFDGTGDYVMFDTLNGPLEGIGTTSPATIEGYFNWDGTQQSGGFRTVIGINRLSDGNNTLVLYCGNSSNQSILGLRYSGGSEQVLDSSIATDTWHHFAMVLNSSSYKFQFFLNGTSAFTSTSTINVAPSDCSFIIGAEADGANAGSIGDVFKGYIDEIRVSHMARYTSNFTAPTEPFADKGQ